MGVRKLNKFLTNKNLIITYRNINEFVNKYKNNNPEKKIIIAIDFWLYAHKFLHSCKNDNILLGFLNQIIKFLSYGIIPLYVMDGSIPLEKELVVEQRNKKRENNIKKINEINDDIDEYININDLIDNDSTLDSLFNKKEKLQKQIKRIKKNELSNIHTLFIVMGIPFIKANFEADALCSKLSSENIITSCLSDDMDMLALGCSSTIKFIDGKLIEFNLQTILKELDFTQEQFIDMCILFGCDYLRHPFRMECNDIYSMIKTHGSLLDILVDDKHENFNMKNNNVKIIGENYYQVQNIYLQSKNKETIDDNIRNFSMKRIDIDKVITFFENISWFDKSSRNLGTIQELILNINNMIEKNII